ncbi:transporter suffix domain-containing protein [Microcoleus sp. FACHB-672]|uniref:transporter suffix domain-containing protein n=1 Tax=Microcoleus sp. FACHB-672 TaxID=2692825 RepID=UPI00168937AD|nr:transporter suffix domain-containing protein [Microcoleus sp. FACHB-672]MBD2042184.1 transporter suffix domain-containing protein [Microcoleus sp. FACHB-672]
MSRNLQKLGLFLIIFSFLPWIAIVAIVPWLPLTAAFKAVLVPVMLVLAEVAFWLALLLVGKEAATRYRRYFNLRTLWKRLRKWIRRH